MRTTSYISVSDHFCGCGGSSEGAKEAGAEIVIASTGPQEERWRAVVGYEGRYEVSSVGRVRSLGVRGKMLATDPVKGGYLRVNLSRDSHDRKYLVHCLVAAAFIGPCPDGHEVNHKDRKTGNNRADNLEYLTPTQNVRHSFAVGERHPARGERNANARLSDSTAAAIRSAFAVGGVTKASLARTYGVSTTLIGRLLNGRTYPEKG